ncbi:helix-turn-helix domain-containing protein [Salinispora fenicalii]|uniref:helix-turn-helix domain-containing protein n=1 Tax=Salinispora fenicalii TaxID=1137263 RepID=UPI00048528EB|nr:AraC family transcriptional regulator [Salinispora fenicalii]
MSGQSTLRWIREANCLQCDKIELCASFGLCLIEPTGATRVTAVASAVDYMIENLAQPIQLVDVARVATMSQFHFHRIFREITCTTPARFLTALRMCEAQHLLLNSRRSVTEICSAVGYSSLGTFISQFGHLTGLSPRRFRTVVKRIGHVPIQELIEFSGAMAEDGPVGAVTSDRQERYCALLGLYRTDHPWERPSTFQVIETNHVVRTPPVSDGEYDTVSVGYSPVTTVADILGAPVGALGRVGFGTRTLIARDGRSHQPFHIALRRQRRFDPPIEFSRSLLSLVARASTRTPKLPV